MNRIYQPDSAAMRDAAMQRAIEKLLHLQNFKDIIQARKSGYDIIINSDYPWSLGVEEVKLVRTVASVIIKS